MKSWAGHSQMEQHDAQRLERTLVFSDREDLCAWGVVDRERLAPGVASGAWSQVAWRFSCSNNSGFFSKGHKRPLMGF